MSPRKLIAAILIAVIAVGAAPSAASAERVGNRSGTCPEWEDEIAIRNLDPYFTHIAFGESRCEWKAFNGRGETSIGPVQMNMRSGFFQARGITAEWLLASPDNYWDGVVILYRECGLGPWTPRRVNGKRVYPCLTPKYDAIRLTDVYLRAMAEAASKTEASTPEPLVPQGFLPLLAA